MFTKRQIQESMRLYAVTDRGHLAGRTLEACVAQAIEGGATCIQLREKEGSDADLEDLARALQATCSQARIPFIINDRVELAAHIGADGVHVGQSDMACARARALLGEETIVGVSAQTVEDALAAERAGADYLGVGAMFATPSKADADDVSLETLKALCSAVSIPVVAIGGITQDTVAELADTGIDGIAVISAVFAADDIVAAVQNLRARVDALLMKGGG